MASGNDARIGFSKETVYGTRVVPARFFPFLSEGIDYAYSRVFVPALGMGMWSRPSRTSTQGGSGPLAIPVTTTGFGYLLDYLHGNTITPVQQGATAAYLQTHTLNTPPSKSASAQVQTPPRSTSTLLPQDFTGTMFGSLELSWGEDQAVNASFSVVVQKHDTTQTLATYVAPTAWSFFTFLDGSITIGGSNVTGVTGSGSLTIDIPLNSQTTLGSGGLISKPVLNDKPTTTAQFTAQFEDFTHWNRVANNTIADLVVKFQHPTVIASTFFPYIEVTVPDCVFSSPRPQVNDAGPLSQAVTASSASSAGNPPVIKYQSTDVTI